jgi:FlaA1/EpsC-like NDP-sugar epimerase
MKSFNRNHFIILVVDILLVVGSLFLAYWVRFDFDTGWFMRMLAHRWVLPFIVFSKLGSFYFFNLYRGMWRYTSTIDLLNIIKACSISSLLIVSVILFSDLRFVGFPRAVFVIDWVFSILLISGFRLFVRFNYEFSGEDKSPIALIRTLLQIVMGKRKGDTNLLILGAGDCGDKIFREIQGNAAQRYNVVGFLDDSPSKVGKMIHGVRVLGTIAEASWAVEKRKVDEILIAIPSARSEDMRRIVDICKATQLPFKTIPGMGELINGQVTINSIREVAYRDLLGREPIRLDEAQIGRAIKGRRVLITGAGGSIGSELCRQACRYQPSQLVLFERAESPLYEIELELRKYYPTLGIAAVLADVQDRTEIERVFDRYRPEVVFHAAAYKHVPMLELQPWKAVKNNVMGTLNMADAAEKYAVRRFVLVSTDKAVRPANVMGATKRVAELILQSRSDCNRTGTQFFIVRFGNVVGSIGSVVPLFKKQIADGGPVTITHPEVTRYFMTIPEACQLILQSAAMGVGGEIFILKMGTPIRIADMARDLIRLSGFEPEVDIPITYVGLRPGEKLYEELITEGEGILPTEHDKILVLRGAECRRDRMAADLEAMMAAAERFDVETVVALLRRMVPEYLPADNAQ